MSTQTQLLKLAQAIRRLDTAQKKAGATKVVFAASAIARLRR